MLTLNHRREHNMNIKILKQFIILAETYNLELNKENLLKYKNLRGIILC
jgi:hypothetical protein